MNSPRYTRTITTHMRYRPYESWSDKEKAELAACYNASPWHTRYHLEPSSGLLNDPNGFSFFNGSWHLFYQNWPFGPAHGLKQWVHTRSTDLLHFTETATRLLPDSPLDSHGAYSGSGREIDGRLFLFYTGNVRDESWVRTPMQNGAWMSADGHITKIDHTLIAQPQDVSEHFRDPAMFEYAGTLYAILGAQTPDEPAGKAKSGFIKLYRARDKHNPIEWEECGNLEYGSTGSEYMVECPCLLFIDGTPVLIYSPQGLSREELTYQNIYPNTYRIFHEFDPEAPALTGEGALCNLDDGFEAYATQGASSPEGKNYIVSWVGLPDVSYPTDSYGYQGAMSLVKELSIRDGVLYQYPVPALKELRGQAQTHVSRTASKNCYEIEIEAEAGSAGRMRLFDDGKEAFVIDFDTRIGTVKIDRTHIGEPFALQWGTTRESHVKPGNMRLNIFVDVSIVEIYLNHGERVLTSRIFPSSSEQSGIACSWENAQHADNTHSISDIRAKYFEINA